MLWDQIVNVAAANGIWALLFVFLFAYQLKDSRCRENKYQQTIYDLTRSLKTVDIIKQDVEDIRDVLMTEIIVKGTYVPNKTRKYKKPITIERENRDEVAI